MTKSSLRFLLTPTFVSK